MNRRTLLAWLASTPFAGLLPWKREPHVIWGPMPSTKTGIVWPPGVERPILDRLQEWYDSWPRYEDVSDRPAYMTLWTDSDWDQPNRVREVPRPTQIRLTRGEIEEFRDALDELMGRARHQDGPFGLDWRSDLALTGALPRPYYRSIPIIESEESDLA